MKPPLILLSGMGADERVFAAQREEFADLLVPKWIEPTRNESLADYAERLAGRVGPHEPCFVGGVSFGGFVAIEMCRHLDVRGCLLIGSVRGPDEFPPTLRAVRGAASMTDAIPFEIISRLASVIASTSRPLASPAMQSFLKQIAQSDGDFLRWASRAVLAWPGDSQTIKAPIHHIHGGRDRILPHRYTRPDVLIADAGHLLTLSHARQVNQFIRDVIS